jgi:hypothetical protein
MVKANADNTRIPSPGGKDEGFRAPGIDREILKRICPPSPYESQQRDVDIPWRDLGWLLAPHVALTLLAAGGALLVWAWVSAP